MSTYYNRSDSSIQNTPTTFNSRHPQNPFRSRSNSYEAPERNRENEGLQVDPNGAYPFPSTRAIDSTSKHIVPWFDSRGSSEKQLARGQEGLITTDEDGDENSGHERIWLFKRRTFIVIVSICVVVAICAAVGGAVGGYYRRQSTHSYVQVLPCQPFLPSSLLTYPLTHNRPPPSLSDRPLSPTDPPSADNLPTATPLPVEQNSTSMAQFPCASATVSSGSAPLATPNAISNPYQSPLGTRSSFDITCQRGIPGWGDKDRNAIATLRTFTTYNLTACMDRCSEVDGCMGVIYNAVLSMAEADGDPGANCLLKNATWDPIAKRKFWLASAVRRE